MDANGKFVVLFVCTGNTCRSPMAEYALRSLIEKRLPGKVKVTSAGTFGPEGYPATLFAQEAALVWNLDLRPHRSRVLAKKYIDEADLILAMAPEHYREVVRLSPTAAGHTYLLKEFPDDRPEGERVEDPIGMDLDDYNQVFLEIGEYLGKHLPEIVKRVDEKLNV